MVKNVGRKKKSQKKCQNLYSKGKENSALDQIRRLGRGNELTKKETQEQFHAC
jgi:hypothetical protein